MKELNNFVIIVRKLNVQIDSQIKEFLKCYSILISNFDEVFNEVFFYENDEIFVVEYKLFKNEYIGICNQSNFENKMDFWLSAIQTFTNKNKSVLLLMDKIYPKLMALGFCAESFYYDYQERDMVWNFVQILPKIFLGGKYYN